MVIQKHNTDDTVVYTINDGDIAATITIQKDAEALRYVLDLVQTPPPENGTWQDYCANIEDGNTVEEV